MKDSGNNRDIKLIAKEFAIEVTSAIFRDQYQVKPESISMNAIDDTLSKYFIFPEENTDSIVQNQKFRIEADPNASSGINTDIVYMTTTDEKANCVLQLMFEAKKHMNLVDKVESEASESEDVIECDPINFPNGLYYRKRYFELPIHKLKASNVKNHTSKVVCKLCLGSHEKENCWKVKIRGVEAIPTESKAFKNEIDFQRNNIW